MSTHFARKMPSFVSVAAGSTASVTIPRGPTYRALHLYATVSGSAATEAQMKASFDAIRLKINGVTRLEGSATDLLDPLSAFYGYATASGVLSIYLALPWLRTIQGEENMAWGTADVDTFTVEIDMNGSASVDAMSLYAEVDPVSRPLGLIREVHKIVVAPSATGVYEVPDLPKQNGALMALHFDHTGSAVLTGLEVFADQVQMFDLNETVHAAILGYADRRNPQTGYIHLDMLRLNRLDDAFPLANLQDFRCKLTVGTAGSVPIIMETLNAPLGAAVVRAA